MKNVNRRHFVKQVGVTGAGLMLGSSLAPVQAKTQCDDAAATIPFMGKYQAGITTPGQKHVYFIVLDLHTDKVEDIKQMFRTWTVYSKN